MAPGSACRLHAGIHSVPHFTIFIPARQLFAKVGGAAVEPDN
jgi:hypothetical protein